MLSFEKFSSFNLARAQLGSLREPPANYLGFQCCDASTGERVVACGWVVHHFRIVNYFARAKLLITSKVGTVTEMVRFRFRGVCCIFSPLGRRRSPIVLI